MIEANMQGLMINLTTKWTCAVQEHVPKHTQRTGHSHGTLNPMVFHVFFSTMATNVHGIRQPRK